MPELQDRIQAVLGDAYRIDREIVGGGMSRLFLATEASLDRLVVVKLLPPETASEVSAARFKREVLVAAKLQHPHILPVLSAGASDGLFYYIMPYVAGESLRKRLDTAGRFKPADALRIIREIADALALAHGRGIVHRDIKPANVLLQEGHAVLTDFGIARAVEVSRIGSAEERLTATGVGIGTVGYMAPEQLAGERDLDARADVYALAVVAYEMFAGQPPFSSPTAQGLLAAHLLETPPDLDSIVPDIPKEICSAIQKALAKSPDDRYLTAAEFRDALDLPLTSSFTAMRPVPAPAARLRRALLIGGGVAAIASAVAVGLLLRSRGRALNEDSVVVLPFNIRGADTTLREGMVDIIVDGLNGQGYIKTVPPSIYVRAMTGTADERTAAELATKLKARFAVFGSVAAVGRDSVEVSAKIFDDKHNRLLGTLIARRGAKEDYLRIANTVVRGLLAEFNRHKALGAFKTTWIENTSLPALQAFLVGEQFFRRSAWDSASAYYERAIEADSTFALAYRHAGLVVGWRRSADDSLSRAYLRRAGQFNRGLPRRDSLLVSADSIRAGLTSFEGDTAYFQSVRRLFRTLRLARDNFQNDPEVWYALGDAYFHYGDGPGLGVSEDTVLAMFDKSIALDSGFTPAYIHSIELGLTLRGRESGLRYAHAYLALDPTDQEADGIRALTSLLGTDGLRDASSSSLLDTLSSEALQQAWLLARRFPDSAETAIHILRLSASGKHDGAGWITNPVVRRALLVRALAYRGHLREASELLGTNIGPRESETFALLVALGGVPRDTARAVFARWLHDPLIWPGNALSWWASERDTASLRIAMGRADSVMARGTDPIVHRNYTYRTAAVRAFLAIARGDADVLERMRRLPDTLCLGCDIDRFAKARVLDSLGQPAAAAELLRTRLHTLLSPIEIRNAWQLGLIQERQQRYLEAARSFALVAHAWAPGDTNPAALAASSLKKVEQLGGDRPQGVRIVSQR